MKNRDLIQEMYKFAIDLSHDLPPNKFSKHRIKWNKLMTECEKSLTQE